MFPNHYGAPQDVVDELKDMLNYGAYGIALWWPVLVTQI